MWFWSTSCKKSLATLCILACLLLSTCVLSVSIGDRLESTAIKTESQLEQENANASLYGFGLETNLSSLPALPAAPPRARFGNAPPLVMKDIESIERQPTIKKLRCNATSAQLNWDSDGEHPVDYYVVYRWNKTDAILEPVWFERNITGTSVTIGQLYPNTEYRFQLQAFSRGRGSNLSAAIKCDTDAGKPVRNPRLVSAYRDDTNGSMVIRWTMVDKKFHGAAGFRYKIYLRRGQTKLPPISINDWTRTERRVKTEKNANYYVRIVSENNFGECESIECKSQDDSHSYDVLGNLEEKLPLKPPQNIQVKLIDGEAVNVTWAPVTVEDLQGNFKYYKIDLTVNNETTEVRLEGNITQVLLTSLQPSSYYQLSMLVANGKSESIRSESIYFVTPAHLSPYKPTFTFRYDCQPNYGGGEQYNYFVQLAFQEGIDEQTGRTRPITQFQYEKCCFQAENRDTNELCEPEVPIDYRASASNLVPIQIENQCLGKLAKFRVAAILKPEGSDSQEYKTYSDWADYSLHKKQWDQVCATVTTTTTTTTTSTTTTTTSSASVATDRFPPPTNHDSGRDSQTEEFVEPGDFPDRREGEDTSLVLWIVGGVLLVAIIVSIIIVYVVFRRRNDQFIENPRSYASIPPRETIPLSNQQDNANVARATKQGEAKTPLKNKEADDGDDSPYKLNLN